MIHKEVKKQSILIISNNYPSRRMPNRGAFVYNLAQELSKDFNITIIAPFKITDLFKKRQSTYGLELCKVYRPLYPSISNKKIIGINFGRLSFKLQALAVWLALKMHRITVDLVYCHFLINAFSILNYIRKRSLPLVVASGESSYTLTTLFRKEEFVTLFQMVNHIVCVSAANYSSLKTMGFDQEKLSVIPNAVDYTLFKPLNQLECRDSLNIAKEKFVVGFIGHFIDRKGPNRVIEAISLIDDDEILLVCVGNNGTLIKNNFTITFDPVANSKLPTIINAFDIFVLPTLSEGHCNTIEEVKACCIPIISSKGTTVELQLDEKTGILIDPTDISEIATNIKLLKDHRNTLEGYKKELEMQIGSNSLQERARKIGDVFHRFI